MTTEKDARQTLRDSIDTTAIVVDEAIATMKEGEAEVIKDAEPEPEAKEPEPAAPETTATDDDEAEPEETKKPVVSNDKFERRIAREVAKTKAAEAQAAELQARLERLEAKADDRPLTEAEVERLAGIKAQQIAAQTLFDNACNNLANSAEREKPGFASRLNELREDVGDLPRPLIDALFNVDNGHSVLNHLTDDIDFAAKLYKMNPVQQAIEVAKLSEKLKAPVRKAVSKAPPPITPIKGGADKVVNSVPTDNDDDDTWFAKREKSRREIRYR